MKISTMLSYSGGFKEAARDVAEMERAGLDLVWVAEAYGFDSPSLMGYLAALHRDGRDRRRRSCPSTRGPRRSSP